MSPRFTRRAFCGTCVSAAAIATCTPGSAQPAAKQPDGLTISIGNYGMKSYKVEEAIQHVAATGFDGIELSVMPEWDSAAIKLTGERRKAVAKLLVDNKLAVESLMEDLVPSKIDTEHQAALDRLKMAAELGRDLYPTRPPLIQTILGPGVWNEKKDLFRDRLGDWLQIAESTKTVIAIKPHRSGAMSQPVEAAWLISQLGNSPWLGMVYDYSHYALRNLTIADTVQDAFPTTVQIVMKDIAQKGKQYEFALPGETGTIDHGEILTLFYKKGFRKNVCCEVSSQVFRREGYDAIAAMKSCFNYTTKILEKSQIPRRPRT